MDFLAGSSLEMPSEPPQDLDPKRSPGLPALQKASKKNHPAGRRQKKNWQSLPSLTKGDFKFNIFFNIQFFVDLNVMSMISYQYSIHGDFFKTRNEPRLCVSLFTTVYWILVATTPFYLQVRGFQSNIDRGEPSL